jgi:hypothetical protein
MPFTVFARARPVRTAFLIAGKAGCDAVCDGLAKWSNEFWGGRQSAIALLEDDGNLTEDAWQELAQFDPDHIWTSAPVSGELLGKLDERMSPWLITESKGARPAQGINQPENNARAPLPAPNFWVEENIQTPGIAVPPTEQNLANFQKRPLLLFEFGKECPAILRRFLHRNLGTYYQWFDPQTGKPRQLGWMENLLSRVSPVRLQVDDLTSLCASLERISGTPHGPGWKPPLAFTAPCELAGIHLSRNLSRGAFEHSYRVVVGSDLRNFLFYWRSCLNEGAGAWDAPFRHCLWVPSELIREAAFITALKSWFYCFTGQGSGGSRVVELTSISQSRDELSAFADRLRAGKAHVPIRLATTAEIESRWRNEQAQHKGRKEFIPSLNGNNAERLMAVDRTQTWELRPPETIQNDVPDGVWAVDVQIEREPREGGLPGQDWWHLP